MSVTCSKDMVEAARDTDDGFSAAGTFSGNPMTLAAGAAVLGYLRENGQLYDEMTAKGDFLRNGFNSHCRNKGYPFCMSGFGSLFQIHAKPELPKVPQDLIGQDEDALAEFQLHFRMNKILAPWIHLSFFGAVHSMENMEEMLAGFIASVDGVMD